MSARRAWKRLRRAGLIAALLLGAVAACNRIVNLTPPDAVDTNDAADLTDGASGFQVDAAIDAGPDAAPDAAEIDAN